MNPVDFDDFDPDNDVTYGLSTHDKEFLLINDCEIFHKKSTKRTIDHGLSLTWACQDRSNCNATLNSRRDYGDLDGSDYDIVRKRVHSVDCLITGTNVVHLRYMNRLMAICKEPGVTQQVQYENIMNDMMIHYLEESRSFPTYH